MSNRSATPPSVARWPFVLGDILLLVIAAITLFTAGASPGPVPLIVATVCIAGGVGLLLAPYLLEYEARVRLAEAAARDASDAQHRRMIQTAEQLAHAVARSQSTEEQAGQALGTLEELAERLTTQADELAQALNRSGEREQARLAGEVDQLARERDGRLGEIGARLDALAAALAEARANEHAAGAAHAKALEGLRAQFRGLADKLDALARPQEPATSSKNPAPPPPAPPLEEPASVVVEEPPAPVVEPAPRPRVRRVVEPVAPPPPAQPAAPQAPAEGELPLEGLPPARPPMRMPRKDAAGATSLVATAYIGIGNKLYLRGEGPGLSWERGVPMQFLAIGKWGWTTTEAGAPITCRIYRNDDTPMLDPDLVVASGEKAEVAPRF